MGTESYVKLRKFTAQDDEDVRDILQRVVDQLHDCEEKTTVQIRLVDYAGGGTTTHYSISLTPGNAFLHPDNKSDAMLKLIPNPAFAIITTSDVFRHMTEGSYSPVQAFLESKIRVQGDLELGKRILARLTKSGTQHLLANSNTQFVCDSCPCITDGTWHPDGNGATGSLTVHGGNATAGGTIQLRFDYGGGQYELFTTADSNNNFTATQQTLFCGDIPGRPGVGVLVTAFDVAARSSSTPRGFSTPRY